MTEIWQHIPGYEGLYEISTLGRIVRAKDKYLMKFTIDSDGYFSVGLTKDHKQRWFRVNRLVAQTYLPNPYNLPIVHHKDNNKQNNSVSNLEWVTVQTNTLHAIHTGRLTFDSNHLKQIAQIRGNNLKKQVVCLDTNKIYPSIQACADAVGLGRDALSRHIRSRVPYKGCMFAFCNKDADG